ncbi:MAG: hypothetical protein K0R34_35 [Herbinix sp.]|nr:hypothetical protein [Herbinix sp.]
MRKRKDIKPESVKWSQGFGIGAVILMLIIYTVTCFIIIDHNPDKSNNTETVQKKADRSVLITREDNLPEDIPVPNAENQVDWECGTYFSNITKEKLESYLELLKQAGWSDLEGRERSMEAILGTASYQLVKEDTLIQLLVFYSGEEDLLSNGILIRMDQDITLNELKDREEIADVNSILPQLQAAVDSNVKEKVIPAARQKIVGVFEIYIPEAYERLALQAFAAVSDRGFTGCFLVRKGVVSYVEGNLMNATIDDIDQDGSDELVDLYSTWMSGLFRNNIIAYEYQNPLFFSSLTEIPIKVYNNCFIPEGEYEELALAKKEDGIHLLGGDTDYGVVTVKGQSLVLKDMEHFPYVEWATSYDQSQLTIMDKKHPKEPPEINITIDGIGLDYVLHKTSWEDEISSYSISEALEEILAKNTYLPKVSLGSFGTEAIDKSIIVDFGDSIPDSIQVADAILDDNGRQLYAGNIIPEQPVKILDSSRVSFVLKQHMSLYLSSNMRDYDRDWRRLFLITCRWEEKECVYALLVNTGKDQQLTQITDQDFIQCEGSYSPLSSTWGLGVTVKSDELPAQYTIEWQVDGGMIRSWNSAKKKAVGITEQHNRYPATYSWDENQGAIIWNPTSYNDAGEVRICAIIYEDMAKNPVAIGELILTKKNGGWRKKE